MNDKHSAIDFKLYNYHSTECENVKHILLFRLNEMISLKLYTDTTLYS